MVRGESVDLHTHTSCSDGVFTPVDLIHKAAHNGVGVLSITDHDSVEAYKHRETFEAARAVGIELVPGIEVSTSEYDEASKETKVHILGLFIDPEHESITGLVSSQQASRAQYAITAGELLRQDGWQLDAGALLNEGTITKAHLADSVLYDPANEKALKLRFGEMPSRGRFIETLMNEGGPCYAEKRTVSAEDAIRVIHAAGGLAIMAHPVANVYEGMEFEEVVTHLKTHDYDGVEAWYYYYSKSRGDIKVDEIDRYISLSQQLGLLVTGGSDYHGPTTTLGNFIDIGFKGEKRIPDRKVYTALCDALTSRG